MHPHVKSKLPTVNPNGRWNTVVEARGGEPVIRWSGVVSVAILIVATASGAWLLAWLGGMTWLGYLISANIAIVGLAALVTRVAIESRLRPDRLPSVDDQQ